MISAVLIVKNEKDLLPRCLESIKGIGEVVVVDTGSIDNTVQIAKDFGCKVGHFKWIDDFSKARNYAMSLATGEFVFIIDADEYLQTPVKEVKRIIKQHSDKKGLYVKTIAEGSKEQNNSIRIFKRGIKYKGAIHETPQVTTDVYTDIEIVYGTSPAHNLDPDIDLRILKKEVSKNPQIVRERFYLAREYFYRGDWRRCIFHLKRYLKVSVWIPEQNEARLLMAKCHSELKDYGVACDWAWEAIKYNTNFKEAIEFIANHMDATNSKRWREFARGANNEGVLFKR